MGKHKALILAAVVMMLSTATTAKATYCEKWSSPFFGGSGSITLDGTTYTLGTGSGYAWCFEQTCPGQANADEFPAEDCDGWGKMYDDLGRPTDSLVLRDSTYSTHENKGCKATGQSSTKEGSGTWCAWDAVHQVFFWGDWDTWSSLDSYKFDYSPSPPTVYAKWIVQGVSSGLAGGRRFFY